jgi:plastocyanin
MRLTKKRAGQVFAGMALMGLLLVSAPATACIRSHHGGMMGSASRLPQDPVVAASNRVTVEIRDFDFVPRDLTVSAGTEVTWVNLDSAPHDATETSGAWATTRLNQDQRATLQFDDPGRFEYRCSIHTDMTAKVTVRPGAAAADTPGMAAMEEG